MLFDGEKKWRSSGGSSSSCDHSGGTEACVSVWPGWLLAGLREEEEEAEEEEEEKDTKGES